MSCHFTIVRGPTNPALIFSLTLQPFESQVFDHYYWKPSNQKPLAHAAWFVQFMIIWGFEKTDVQIFRHLGLKG